VTQKGTHTWDLVIDYHRCPQCGNIIESRTSYHYVSGKYQKEVECERCQNRFMAIKPTKLTFGPLIGDPQPTEIDWRE
jgi:hypothetical protein